MLLAHTWPSALKTTQVVESFTQRGKARRRGHTAERRRPGRSWRAGTGDLTLLFQAADPPARPRRVGAVAAGASHRGSCAASCRFSGREGPLAPPAAEALRTLMGDKGSAVAGAWRSAGSFPSLQQRTDLAGGQAGRRIPLPRLWLGHLSRTVWTGLGSQRLPHLQTLVADWPAASTKCLSSL